MSIEAMTKKSHKPEDIQHMRDLHAAMLEQSAPKVVWVLYLIAVIVVSGLVWASFAEVEEVITTRIAGGLRKAPKRG